MPAGSLVGRWLCTHPFQAVRSQDIGFWLVVGQERWRMAVEHSTRSTPISKLLKVGIDYCAAVVAVAVVGILLYAGCVDTLFVCAYYVRYGACASCLETQPGSCVWMLHCWPSLWLGAAVLVPALLHMLWGEVPPLMYAAAKQHCQHTIDRTCPAHEAAWRRSQGLLLWCCGMCRLWAVAGLVSM